MAGAVVNGVVVRAEPALAGCNRAVRVGAGPVLVSPAVWSLLAGAESAGELARLLRAIEVVCVPGPASVYGPAPGDVAREG